MTPLALVSRVYQLRTPRTALPQILGSHPLTPNIYYQRQPLVTNSFKVFTKLRHACYQYW
jgi:hypothetical protein